MPALRLFVSLLLSLTLVATLAFLPETTFTLNAQACPVSPPQPLRTLYQMSERVVVANVGASVQIEVEDNSRLMRTLLNVSETLKGDANEHASYVYHWVWQGTREDVAEVNNGQFEFGDRLLVFLNRREKGDGYAVNDTRYGVKKLNDDDLKVYVKRIKELDAILRQKQPDVGDITEWLVRCAEEPATRWEGAYELSISANALDKRNKPTDLGAGNTEAVEVKAEGASPEETTDDVRAPVISANVSVVAESAGVTDNTNGASADNVAEAEQPLRLNVVSFIKMSAARARYAEKLNAGQKSRLASALFGAEEIGEGEHMLIQVLETFKDERLVPFLSERLRRTPENPPDYGWLMMAVVARARDDKEMLALAGKFGEINPYTVMYEEDESSEEEEKDDEAAQAEESSSDDEDAEESEAEEETEAQQVARLEAAQKVVVQRRQDVLRQFLARMDNPTKP